MQPRLMSLSFQRFFFVMGSILLTIAFLYIAKPLLVPLAFALLMSFILYPIARWLELRGVNRVWSTVLTVVLMLSILISILALVSTKIFSISSHFGDFTGKLYDLMREVTIVLNRVPFIDHLSTYEVMEKSKDLVATDDIMTGTLSATTSFLSGFGLTFIYTFLILLYRSGLREGFVGFAFAKKRDVFERMINNIQSVGQKYLTGMFLLIIILGLLNSLGLLLLGIDYALFFGFLASLMSIVPYVGTVLGGAIPTFYALMNCDSVWYPIGVVLIFVFVQFIEGNFLNPRIVGGNLQLNALAAILSLIAGGLLWGIPGMILFLPYTAVLKEICKSYKQLHPVSCILENKLYEPNPSSRQALKDEGTVVNPSYDTER